MKFKLTPIVLAFSVLGLSACGGNSSDNIKEEVAEEATKSDEANSTEEDSSNSDGGSKSEDISGDEDSSDENASEDEGSSEDENNTVEDKISYSVNFSFDAGVKGLLCADSNEDLDCNEGEAQVIVTENAATLTSEDVAVLNSNYIFIEDKIMKFAAPAAIANNDEIVMNPVTSLVFANMLQGYSKQASLEYVADILNEVLSLDFSAEKLLTESNEKLTTFNTEFNALWHKAQLNYDNKVTLLSGFAIQLKDVASSILNNTHFNQLESFIKNSVTWSEGFPMTDTGVTLFANLDGFENKDSVKDFPGQDADYGLDTAQPEESDGHAGFSYLKLSDTGTELSADAENWSCVKDLKTGLIWEVKSDTDGLRHKDTLLVYKPTNISNVFDAEVAEASCEDEKGICTVAQYEAYINSLNEGSGLCGIKNWQLPSFNELYTLVNFGSTNKNTDDELIGIDTNFFPYTHAGDVWSSTPSIEWHTSMSYSPNMWTLGFNDSYIGATTSYEYCVSEDECDYPSALPVRLVSKGEE